MIKNYPLLKIEYLETSALLGHLKHLCDFDNDPCMVFWVLLRMTQGDIYKRYPIFLQVDRFSKIRYCNGIKQDMDKGSFIYDVRWQGGLSQIRFGKTPLPFDVIYGRPRTYILGCTYCQISSILRSFQSTGVHMYRLSNFFGQLVWQQKLILSPNCYVQQVVKVWKLDRLANLSFSFLSFCQNSVLFLDTG